MTARSTDKPLYRHSIVLRVPVWLVKGTMAWQTIRNRGENEIRLENGAAPSLTQPFPLRYRIKLTTPPWARAMCRQVSAAKSGLPAEKQRGLMIQHQTTSEIEDQVWVQGETRVDGVPLVRSDLEYVPTEAGQTRCDMMGLPLDPDYRGLLTNVAGQMQQTVVEEQRLLEARARILAIAILMTLRFAEPVLAPLARASVGAA